MAKFNVKLTGTAQWTGGGLSWKTRQVRTFDEGDPRLDYCRGKKKAFTIWEVREGGAALPKRKAKEKVVPAPSPASDLDAEEGSSPLEPEPASELDLDDPPGPSLPSDEELEAWQKKPLLELAEEHGLDVNSSMTKAEIRAAIDTIR